MEEKIQDSTAMEGEERIESVNSTSVEEDQQLQKGVIGETRQKER